MFTCKKARVFQLFRQNEVINWPFTAKEASVSDNILVEGTLEWCVAKALGIIDGGRTISRESLPFVAEIIASKLTSEEQEAYMSINHGEISVSWTGVEKGIMQKAFERISLSSDLIKAILKEKL